MYWKTSRYFLLFAGLCGVACFPVWIVDIFANQDGIPHLYNAYLLLELLNGNPAVSEFARLNPNLIPNLTGHWILASMLVVFEPATATKLMVTALYAFFVGSTTWLRTQVAGREGLGVTLLFSAAIGMNWLWLFGFYNFILGLSLFAIALGCWWRWREDLTTLRSLALFVLITLTYFSHLVCFAALLGALGFLTAVQIRVLPKRSLYLTVLILALTTPLIFIYLAFSRTGGGLHAEWQFIREQGIVTQLTAADPFAILSRKALPFIQGFSWAFALLSPTIFIGVLAVGLILGSVRSLKSEPTRNGGYWFAVAAILAIAAVFGPDNLGSAHGGYLRERLMLLSLICCLPAIRVPRSITHRSIAVATLLFIIIFQTLALLEYSLRGNTIAAEFAAAKPAIPDQMPLASIMFISNTGRFKPIAEVNFSSYLGIGKNTAVWDNYEFGYYLFPVQLRHEADREFASAFRESSVFDLNETDDKVAARLDRLAAVLERDHQRIDTLLIWNEQGAVESIRSRWFDPTPYYQSERIRLYRHR